MIARKPKRPSALVRRLSLKANLGWWSGLMLIVPPVAMMLTYWLIVGRGFFYSSTSYFTDFLPFGIIWGLGGLAILMSALLNRLSGRIARKPKAETKTAQR